MNEAYVSLLNAFIKERGLVKFQVDSFNDFLDRKIPKILEEIGTIKPDVPELGNLKIKLGKFSIERPMAKEADGSLRPVLPLETRIRDITYASPMYVEMTSVLNNIQSEPKNINFGDLPIMLKSKLCPLAPMNRNELIQVGEDPDDPGGYFIINGTERLLVLVEEIAPNRIITAKVSSGSIEELARIHSEKEGYVQRHLMERKIDGMVTISFANITRLPVVYLLKALGLTNDKEIVTAVSDDPEVQEEFYVNLLETTAANVAEGLEEIGKYLKIPQPQYRIERATKLVDKYLLPHLGQNPEDRLKKALFLSKAIGKLTKLHLDKVEEDDLDHYSNKRLRLAGDLMEILLRSIILGKWGLVTRVSYNYRKLTKRGRMPPLQAIVESNVLTNQIVSSMAIGSWVGGRTGVCQRVDRGSYIKTLSHMRNILSPLTSTQEHFEARELHPTHWGKVCTSQTPEGATIGLRKYLAILAEVTKGTSEDVTVNLENVIKKTEGVEWQKYS